MRHSPRRLRRSSALCHFTLIAVLASHGPSAAGAVEPPVSIPRVQATAGARPIQPRDILAMREATALSVSPDGKRVAFRVRQLDYDADTERGAWYVADVTRPGSATYVGDAGQPNWEFLLNEQYQDLLNTPARWSPDGRTLAYPAFRDGAIQIWLAKADGSGFEQLTRNAADVSRLVWLADGTHIVFRTGLTRAARAAAIRDKQAHGVRLHNGETPKTSADPFTAESELFSAKHDDYIPIYAQRWDHSRYLQQAEEFWSIDLRTRKERKASPEEVQSLQALNSTALAANPRASLSVVSPDGRETAYSEHADGPEGSLDPTSRFVRRDQLFIKDRSGVTRKLCEAEPCVGRIMALAWSPDGSEVYFQRREGNHFDTLGFYAVGRANKRVRTILRTQELLVGDMNYFRGACPYAGERVYCLREAATTPPQVVAVSMRRGEVKTLVELNPEFRSIELLPAQRLDWTTADGVQAYGWLVKPKGYRSGERYPLVLIPDRLRGFLRGGDGNEYPIQWLAQNGFAVLAFMYDNTAEYSTQARTLYERRKFSYVSYVDTLEAAIDLLDRRGLIDRRRVGLTGMSDTGDKGTYAVTHTQALAAAALSGGAWDPTSFLLADKQWQALLTAEGLGYPDPQGPYWTHWLELSPALNAHRTRAALMMNVCDAEILMSVELFRKLVELGKPVETFVYYEEPHFKVKPSHLHEINVRNFDWFNFWLRDVEDPSPQKQEQYLRWRAMRAGGHESPAGGSPERLQHSRVYAE